MQLPVLDAFCLLPRQTKKSPGPGRAYPGPWQQITEDCHRYDCRLWQSPRLCGKKQNIKLSMTCLDRFILLFATHTEATYTTEIRNVYKNPTSGRNLFWQGAVRPSWPATQAAHSACGLLRTHHTIILYPIGCLIKLIIMIILIIIIAIIILQKNCTTAPLLILSYFAQDTKIQKNGITSTGTASIGPGSTLPWALAAGHSAP